MRCDMVEQRTAGLHIGDDRGALAPREQVFGEHHQQLVAPDDPAFAVDRTDTVAVPVESHPEIERLLGDQIAQIGEVLLDSGIGVMIGKFAIDIGKQQVMFARKTRGELFERGTGRAVPRVPTDLEAGKRGGIDPVKRFQHPIDIGIDDIAVLDRSRAVDPFARTAPAAELLDVRPEKRPPLKHHLEAVVIGGVVAAGYLDAAIHVLG